MDLIPQPRHLRIRPGQFDLQQVAVITIGNGADGRIVSAARELAGRIAQVTGRGVSAVKAGADGRSVFHLALGDPASQAEWYRIAVLPDRVLITGDGLPGLFYGLQTLTQIVFLEGSRIPCLEITDAPLFPHRGILHDVTRGKVPKLDTMKGLASRLASYKINQLQLYIEHSFAFEAVPEFGRNDPITADEIRELDAHCRERFIDLVPTLATFGHLYELLRLPRFEHLNELEISASGLPHDLWDRMAHYTIDCCNPESFAIIKRMLDEFLPLFTSGYCNICCDETFDLGNGRNSECARKTGRGRLYVDFVKKIVGVVREHGKTPMIWGDIVLHYPELIPELSDDVVFLDWGYSAEVTGANERVFAERERRHYACPGVQGWSRFANDIESAGRNIGKMVRFGHQYHAEGIVTTDWGDCGHVNLLANSRHGMALGAALSWNVESYGEAGRFDSALSSIEWGDRSGEVAKLLRELGSLCSYHFGNIYAWVNGLDCLWNKEAEVARPDQGDLDRKIVRARAIGAALAGFRAPGRFSGDPRDLEEFIWSSQAIEWTLLLLKVKNTGNESERSLLVEKGKELVGRFEQLWRMRNKESELRNVTGTFEKVWKKLKKEERRKKKEEKT